MSVQSKLSGAISKYLEKLGVADFTGLTGDERSTYDEWQEVLRKEANVEDLVKFIEYQLATLTTDLRKAIREGDDRQALYTTARLENYEAMRGVLTAPERNKEALAKHITSLLNKE